MNDRYFATTRQFTGVPVYRGYVRDRETGKVLAACPHRHKSRRLNKWSANGRIVISGNIAAQKCAEKLLREFLAVRRGD